MRLVATNDPRYGAFQEARTEPVRCGCGPRACVGWAGWDFVGSAGFEFPGAVDDADLPTPGW